MSLHIKDPVVVEMWLDRLVKISCRIAGMEDVHTVLTDIMSITRELMSADTASLALLEAEDRLILKYQATPEGSTRLCNCPIDSPVVWSAIHSASTLRFPEDTPHVEMCWDCNEGIYAIQSASVAPLRLDNTSIGVLWVGRYSGKPFTPTDLTGLGHLAAQAVIALEHASMAARLQSFAVVEERSRIAREMHDSLAQILGYLGLEMQTLEALTRQGDREGTLAELKQAREMIKSAQADVRGNILSLRTTLAGEINLTAALQKYCNEFEIQTGVTTRLIDETEAELTLSPLAETQLVRIVQEGLTNVRKHAQASSVQLKLMTHEGWLCMTIVDDGIGIQQDVSCSHFGLQTMRERAESVGGSLTVSSIRNHGTRIELYLPLL